MLDEGGEILETVMELVRSAAPDNPALQEDGVPSEMEKMVRMMRVRDVPEFARIGETALRDLDARLRQIPNL